MHSPGFDFQPRTRVVFGAETIERIGELARELGARHALLVTDKGIVEAGHPARAIGFIEAAGLHVTTYDAVRENPTTVDVDRCVEAAPPGGNHLILRPRGRRQQGTA